MIEAKFNVNREDFTLQLDTTLPGTGVTALFGRSGSGKTTIINVLAGLLKPNSGFVSIDGKVLFDSDKGINVAADKRRLGYVFQEGRLFPHMTVKENLVYGMKSNSSPIPSEKETIDLLGLAKLLHRTPVSLSGGERQRVAIGRALLCSPKLLLMDEPLAALDAARKQELLPYISRLKDILNIPIIYVSHQIQEIMHLADTLVLLENGKLLKQGPVDQIINNPKISPYFGEDLKSSFIRCIVDDNHHDTSVSNLRFDGGFIKTTILGKPVGSSVRVRIRAQDVAVSIKHPKDISRANIFEVKIQAIEQSDRGFVNLNLILKNTVFWARLTKTSVENLNLIPGRVVFALFKSTAIEILGH